MMTAIFRIISKHKMYLWTWYDKKSFVNLLRALL